MACILHDIYYGGNSRFGGPQQYALCRFAVKRDHSSGEFSDYNDYATRAEAAYIFSNSVRRRIPGNRRVRYPGYIKNTVYGGQFISCSGQAS